MADRPILFSAPMVRALLDSRKTQTRRVIEPQPSKIVTGAGYFCNSRVGFDHWEWLSGDPTDLDALDMEGSFTLPWREGDRLWVREAWRVSAAHGALKPSDLPSHAEGTYEADYDPDTRVGVASGRYRAARFMPRRFSRITLLVTDVRVEQVQQISEADAKAEGVAPLRGTTSASGTARNIQHQGGYLSAFIDLWNSINAARGHDWDANPWVGVVTFSVLWQNIDKVR